MLIDCHTHIGVDLYFYLNGYSPYAQDLPQMIVEGTHCGVDRWVVFPMVTNLTFDIPEMLQKRMTQGGIEKVPYALENRRMLREIYVLYPDMGSKTLPFVILDPSRKTREQAAELRALYAEFPFYGLKIQPTIIQSDIGALLNEGRVFVDLARELNLPFLIHSSVAPEDTWSQAKTILRVAEANPDVRFCLAHSCRYDKECLDRVAALPNTWFDCSAHRIHCDGVVRGMGFVAPPERRFKANYANPSDVLRSLAEAYPTKLIWGSDVPFQSYVAHIDGVFVSLRSTYRAEVDCVHALPAPLKQAVGHDNILNLLQLKDDSILSRG